jgi:hypothetical protein
MLAEYEVKGFILTERSLETIYIAMFVPWCEAPVAAARSTENSFVLTNSGGGDKTDLHTLAEIRLAKCGTVFLNVYS